MSGRASNITLALRDDPDGGQARAARIAAAQGAWWNALREGNPPVPPSRFRGLSAAAARGIPVSVRDHLPTAVTGLALIFLPLQAVRALTGIEAPGGTLVGLSGLDTVFFDVSLVSMFVVLWRRRHLVGDRLLSVIFCVSLAGSMAILLGYVVTNFGTLLRMRASGAIPLWMLCLAVAPRRESSGPT